MARPALSCMSGLASALVTINDQIPVSPRILCGAHSRPNWMDRSRVGPSRGESRRHSLKGSANAFVVLSALWSLTRLMSILWSRSWLHINGYRVWQWLAMSPIIAILSVLSAPFVRSKAHSAINAWRSPKGVGEWTKCELTLSECQSTEFFGQWWPMQCNVVQHNLLCAYFASIHWWSDSTYGVLLTVCSFSWVCWQLAYVICHWMNSRLTGHAFNSDAQLSAGAPQVKRH